MKPFLIRAIAKITLACIVIMFISIFLTAFYPTINNQMAMGQLENDDFAFATWEMWQNIYATAQAAIYIVSGITSISVICDVCKYFKSRKEN